ncbi:hypothetical protein PHLGIDRAFT_341757 [Phlebiopsis gigantea 11061_1 CR5-6]|uniref:Uncharacterized protein n=1 Tax=Phlebiopsis gigantea (strain 11061_1 CR5-6) TaxID=745531 RepID=A0A0C3RZ49_PHLG1|nr:hypothetical protein PHLGIDRAFT_341757 [Phlebiopsis gigantea 11061_1 CR5-6]
MSLCKLYASLLSASSVANKASFDSSLYGPWLSGRTSADVPVSDGDMARCRRAPGLERMAESCRCGGKGRSGKRRTEGI